jgi:hypothetical protein
MNDHQFNIRFVGGPSDGVVVAATTFPFGESFWMPASAITIDPTGNRCYMSSGHLRALYCLSYTHHTVEDGNPTIHHEFRFAGFESLKTEVETKPIVGTERHWLSRIVRHIVRWRTRDRWSPLQEGCPHRHGQLAALNPARVGSSSAVR